MTEIRKFLILYALRRGMEIQEHAGDPDQHGTRCYYAHISLPGSDPARTVTAVSYESQDSALVMGFLQWSNSALDFLAN